MDLASKRQRDGLNVRHYLNDRARHVDGVAAPPRLTRGRYHDQRHDLAVIQDVLLPPQNIADTIPSVGQQFFT